MTFGALGSIVLYMGKTGYKKIKTASYDRAAIDRYRAKYDIVSDRLPAGTVERMRAAGFTPSDRVAAIMAALEKREKENSGGDI